MHLCYVLAIKAHASDAFGFMMMYGMKVKASVIPVSCCCPSAHPRKAGARARPRQSPDQSSLCSGTFLQHSRKDETIDWIPALLVQEARFVMLESLSPGL